MKYLPIIGLEVHVELKTKSKMFCRCSTDIFSKSPNTYTCPVCLGLPGALPVPNKTAIDWCIKIALALNCTINEFSKFDRKNYFYPDLSKGYQISQYDLPFGHDGFIELANKKRVRIRRVHMEEDTGKLIHQEIDGQKVSLIDFNRSGIPLVEIVTEPDFNTGEDVKEYLQKLQQIVRYLDVANADMDKGEMRLEPNISLYCHPECSEGSSLATKKDSSALPQNDIELPNYKVEVKNINSFRFVEKTIAYEIKRQQELLEKGETPAQETRGWDEVRQKTFSQRMKEEAQDYRYFPEPDIPPIITSKKQISTLKDQMPELPVQKLDRFEKEYGISSYDAEILTRDKSLADYFEETVAICHPELVSGSPILSKMPKQVRHDNMLTPKDIANAMIHKKVDIANILPAALIQSILAAKQTVHVDEKELENAIKDVLSENQKAVEDYKNGKEPVIMFLVGQVMRKIGQKIDAQMVKEKIERAIKKT